MLSASIQLYYAGGIIHWAMSLKTTDISIAFEYIDLYVRKYFPGASISNCSVCIVNENNEVLFGSGIKQVSLIDRLCYN